MRRIAIKIVLFLLIGTAINIIVALACDWNASTTAHPLKVAIAVDAKALGWSGRVPSDASPIVAVWHSSVRGFDLYVALSCTLQGVRMESNGDSVIMPWPPWTPPGEPSVLLLEAQGGWPIRSFVSRADSKQSPSATTAILDSRVKIDLSIETLIPTSDGKVDVYRGHRGAARVTHIQNAIVIERKERREVSHSENPREGCTMTVSRAILEPPPLTGSRWDAESFIQNFDPDHRVWPLAYRPLWPGFAINTVFYALILWLLFAAPRAVRSAIRTHRGLCPKCAYDLRGGPHEKCPECGFAVTPASTSAV